LVPLESSAKRSMYLTERSTLVDWAIDPDIERSAVTRNG